jgi:LL-diaminopimelate aminotransferase
VLNFPNSPTGAVADISFYEEVVEFAKRHKLVVIQDAAHAMLSYAQKPTSFLQAPGAMDVGVEVHSLSKGFHMIGWRMGFVAGNEKIVRAFSDIKDNSDSGQFIAIQKAAAAALRDPSIPTAVRTKYERRLHKLVQTLNDLGFQAQLPGGTYFLYVKAPTGTADGRTFKNAEEVSQFLIRERSICTVPWDDAGAYLRFSVTYLAPTEGEEDRLMETLLERLRTDQFRFS